MYLQWYIRLVTAISRHS